MTKKTRLLVLEEVGQVFARDVAAFVTTGSEERSADVFESGAAKVQNTFPLMSKEERFGKKESSKVGPVQIYVIAGENEKVKVVVSKIQFL
nr:hypothetical protein BaRGS_028843 [Batillaria attramentaria]